MATRAITGHRRKVHQIPANRALLGWLLLPQERVVEIWRERQQGMAERLVLELEEIWAR